MISMRKSWIRIVLIVVFTFTGMVYAQDPPSLADDRPNRREEREKIRENIETLRMWKLLEVLNLTAEQSTRFLPVLKEFQTAKKIFEDRRKELLGELEKTLQTSPDEKMLKEIMREMENDRRQFLAASESYMEKAKTILSTEQQAQLLLFEDKFERRIRETIEQIRGGHPRWKEKGK